MAKAQSRLIGHGQVTAPGTGPEDGRAPSVSVLTLVFVAHDVAPVFLIPV